MLSQGKIVDANGVGLIYPDLTEDAFLSSVGLKAEENILNGDYHSFDIESLVIGKTNFAARIFFKQGQLWMLSLYLVDGSSWSNWSEEEEMRRKAKHDEFLNQELGNPPYVFSWGKVESIFDRKGGSSSIVINYGE